MPSLLLARRDDDERPKNILRISRRPGATEWAPSYQTTHFYRAHTSPMAHYSYQVTVFETGVMERCGWTSRKSDVFSVFLVQPIRRRITPLRRNTTGRRERAKSISTTEEALSCPSFCFKSSTWVSGDKGGPFQLPPGCCLLRLVPRDQSNQCSAHPYSLRPGQSPMRGSAESSP